MEAWMEAVTWTAVRDDFFRINSQFAQIIDAIRPTKRLRLYRVKYPYGYEFVKKGRFYLPIHRGRLLPLHSDQVSQQIQADLSYNLGSNPVCFIMDKSFELYMELANRITPVPYALVTPGNLFSASYVLRRTQKTHQPAFLWNISAGARSILMLAKISKEKNYQRIRKLYGCDIQKPSDLYQHWQTFKALYEARILGEWNLDIIYFAKAWFENLDSKRFFSLKHYMQKTSFMGSEFWQNQFIWNTYFSVINNQSGIKPNPYIYDTVRHLLTIAIGALPGMAPATNEVAAPIKALQKIFIDDYRSKYRPTIMHLKPFSMYSKTSPVYYSLQYPNAMELSPSSNDEASTISQLYEVKNLLAYYLRQFVESNISETIMYDIQKFVHFNFFHTTPEGYRDIKHSEILFREDNNMNKMLYEKNYKSYPLQSSYIKGCVKIST